MDHRDEGLEAWGALLRCHAALVPRLSQQVQRQAGMPLSWYDVLLELRAAEDGRLRLQELGERVVLSRSRVSRVVDEMSTAGLVERVPDPDDGRAAFAALTQDGTDAFLRAAPAYLAAIEEHFASRLTSAERKAIARGLGRVLSAR